MDEELREFSRVNMLAPLFVQPLYGVSADDCPCGMKEQGFDEYFRRSLYKKVNISVTGIAFESDQPYAQGSILEIRFMLDDVYTGIIDLCAEVVRVDMQSRGFLVAGRFISMDKTISDLICQFIRLRENRPERRKVPRESS
jgi:hypothetical protein